MKIDDAIQWLNNRGHMFKRSDINKVAKVGHYLFVKEKEETEVDLYCLTDMQAAVSYTHLTLPTICSV